MQTNTTTIVWTLALKHNLQTAPPKRYKVDHHCGSSGGVRDTVGAGGGASNATNGESVGETQSVVAQ